NLKDKITKAEIEEMKTIMGSDYNLVLVQLKTNSSFGQSKKVSLGEKQVARHVWNLKEIKKGLQEENKQLDKTWETIEKAIIRATESMLPNKLIRTPKKQSVPNKECHISKAYMNLDQFISESQVSYGKQVEQYQVLWHDPTQEKVAKVKKKLKGIDGWYKIDGAPWHIKKLGMPWHANLNIAQ
ncbi:14751_t:CDS:2, partial [Gigaspora margarita]